MEPDQEGDWRRKPLRLLLVVLLCGVAIRLSDVHPLDGLYSLLGIEKMPWQR